MGRFYRKVAPEGCDLVVRYEDLLRRPVEAVAEIAWLLDMATWRPTRRGCGRWRGASAAKGAGPEPAPEALREIARRELAEVRRKLAYG